MMRRPPMIGIREGIDPALLLMVETYLASTRISRLNDQLAALVRDFRRTLACWPAERGRVGDAEAMGRAARRRATG